MKKKTSSFKFPVTIKNPVEIIDALSDEQHDALCRYMDKGYNEYVKSMFNELARVERELERAGKIIEKQSKLLINMVLKSPILKLRNGIDIKSGLN